MIKLVGMMDSPYVRRVAISLELYGVEFESQPLSVFSTFDAFSRINPAVKAPTLILDNGIRLMDSSLILNYFETQAAPGRRLLPVEPCKMCMNTTSARWKSSTLYGSNALQPSCWRPAGNGMPCWRRVRPPPFPIRLPSRARLSGRLFSR